MRLSKKELRGGAQKGAGRKTYTEKYGTKEAEKIKRHSIGTTVSYKTKINIKKIDKNQGKAIDKAIAFYLKQHGLLEK